MKALRLLPVLAAAALLAGCSSAGPPAGGELNLSEAVSGSDQGAACEQWLGSPQELSKALLDYDLPPEATWHATGLEGGDSMLAGDYFSCGAGVPGDIALDVWLAKNPDVDRGTKVTANGWTIGVKDLLGLPTGYNADEIVEWANQALDRVKQ